MGLREAREKARARQAKQAGAQRNGADKDQAKPVLQRLREKRKPALAALRERHLERQRAEAQAAVDRSVAHYDETFAEEQRTFKVLDKLDRKPKKHGTPEHDEAKLKWKAACRKNDAAYKTLHNAIASTRNILNT
jgi:hypothetical protein